MDFQASAIPIKGKESIEVHELSQDDIKRYVGHYQQAAASAFLARSFLHRRLADPLFDRQQTPSPLGSTVLRSTERTA